MKIGRGFLDDDLYKIKVCYAISELYPNDVAEFRFINRGKHKFSPTFVEALKEEICNEKNLLAYSEKSSIDLQWLSGRLPEVKATFWSWLRDFKYNPSHV